MIAWWRSSSTLLATLQEANEKGLPAHSFRWIQLLARHALLHISHADEMWDALRGVLVTHSGDVAMSAWYLLDSLMKHAPCVFVPLLSSASFVECVERCMPWEGAQCSWCETLVGTWRDALPQSHWEALAKFAAQKRAQQELAVARSLTSTDDRVELATVERCAVLQDKLLSLVTTFSHLDRERRLGEVGGGLQGTEELPESVALRAPPFDDEDDPEQVDGSRANEDDDDEYAPDFVSGGAVREKPVEALVKKQPRKRARPAAEDD